MNINLKIRFNLTGGKVHDDQATSTEDTSVKTTKRVICAKNTNDETTHQSTADKAEEILNPKK